jgi:hypothetical protein
MRCKATIKTFFTIVVIIFMLLFFMLGCGYFERDKTEYQKNIVGNIKIQKQENSNLNNLVFAETNEIYSVIIEDCKFVYYDTLKNQIFADSYINETNRNYYQINILDASSNAVSKGIMKEQINERDFISKTKFISNKWVFEEQKILK